jgi:hypothetical protein
MTRHWTISSASLILLQFLNLCRKVRTPLKSAAERENTLAPRSEIRGLIFSLASAALISAFSFSTFGVSRGAAMPCQPLVSPTGGGPSTRPGD